MGAHDDDGQVVRDSCPYHSSHRSRNQIVNALDRHMPGVHDCGGDHAGSRTLPESEMAYLHHHLDSSQDQNEGSIHRREDEDCNGPGYQANSSASRR